jgi:hypothetical protein
MADQGLIIAILVVVSVTLFLFLVILAWKWWNHKCFAQKESYYMTDKKLFSGYASA